MATVDQMVAQIKFVVDKQSTKDAVTSVKAVETEYQKLETLMRSRVKLTGDELRAIGQLKAANATVAEQMAAMTRKEAEHAAKRSEMFRAAGQQAKAFGDKVQLAFTAATVAIAAYTVQQAQLITQDGRMAKSLGITIQQWQALQYAAEQSGASVEDVRGALNGLQGNLAGARDGSAETVKLFNKLGVSWKNADGSLRSSAEVLPDLAKGLTKLPAGGERTNAMLKLMGESGTRLAGILENDGKELARLTAEAKELGVVMDQDTLDAANGLTKSLGQFWGTLKGIGGTLVKEVGPPLQKLADQLNEALKPGSGWLRLHLDVAIEKLGYAFSLLETPAGKAFGALTALGGLWWGASAVMSNPIVTNLAASIGTKLVPAISAMWAALGGPPAWIVGGLFAAAAATVGLFSLVLDELWVTAMGGDSVIRRLADALGIGEETVAYFAAGLRVVNAVGGLTWDILSSIGIAFGDLITLGSQLGSTLATTLGPIFETWLSPWVILKDTIQWLIGAVPRLIGYLTGIEQFTQLGEAITEGPQATTKAGLDIAAGGLNYTADRLEESRAVAQAANAGANRSVSTSNSTRNQTTVNNITISGVADPVAEARRIQSREALRAGNALSED